MNARPRPVLDGIPASRLQLPPGPWATVFEGLCARFPGVDAATWQARFERGRVLDAEGRAIPASTPYRVGAEIHYFREVAAEPEVAGREAVVHADEHLVVAFKPHFLPVAPTGAWVRETLLTRLVQRLGNQDLVPLHRIDRETAGLVMFSAEPSSRARYQALFARGASARVMSRARRQFRSSRSRSCAAAASNLASPSSACAKRRANPTASR